MPLRDFFPCLKKSKENVTVEASDAEEDQDELDGNHNTPPNQISSYPFCNLVLLCSLIQNC